MNSSMRFSDGFTFKSAPAPSEDPNRKTIAATFADHGTFELFGFKTIDKLVELYNSGREDDRYEFVHVAGDLSYAGLSAPFNPLNISKEDEFEHIWDLLAIQTSLLQLACHGWSVMVITNGSTIGLLSRLVSRCH